MNTAAQMIRQRIEFENNLVNQRMGALVGSQSFLVSAFTIGLNAPSHFRAGGLDAVHRLLMRVLPVAGLCVVVMMSISILAAILALNGLHARAAARHSSDDPPIHSHPFLRWMGYSAALGIPVIFLVLWSLLLAAT